MPIAADLARVRADFPALARRVGAWPVAYLDGPGGTQVPQRVADAVREYLLHHNANTHWAYPTSRETDELIAGARAAVADLLGAAAAEIAFGANMTTLTFHLARALARRWAPGDEVVVTDLDHHANIAPWQAVAAERGLVLRRVPFRVDAGEQDWDALAGALTPRTRLLAIGAASNALGTITDIRRAATLARHAGALTCVDAVHYVPHRLVDVRAWGCDFLACSAYKFYGPHVGILYGRSELLADLDVPKLEPAPNEAPDRLETGTQNHEGIAGTLAAVEWLASLGEGDSRRARLAATYAAFEARETSLFGMLWEGLSSVPGVRRFGLPPGAPRTATLACSTGSAKPGAVAAALAERGLFVSHGDFYATTVVERLGHGRDGLLRIGISCYTSEDEVRRLVAALGEVLQD